MRGGKAYKKGKKGGGEEKEEGGSFFQRNVAEGQDYGRVTAKLGDRRVRCFCNDGTERTCKIRGALCKGPKKKYIEVGDIVILSVREFDTADETYDLIDKVPRKYWRDVRREKDIHSALFYRGEGEEGDGLDDLFDNTGVDGQPIEDEESSGEDEIDVDAI
jgi:initiation factor 1A